MNYTRIRNLKEMVQHQSGGSLFPKMEAKYHIHGR